MTRTMSPHTAPSPHEDADGAVHALADRAWKYRLAREPYLQLRVGVPVTHLRPRGPEEAQEDSDFARILLAELDTIDSHTLSESSRLTAVFLRGIFSPLLSALEDLWYTFPVTPYNAHSLSLYMQHVLAPFTVNDTGDADRYLSLLADYARILQVDREVL